MLPILYLNRNVGTTGVPAGFTTFPKARKENTLLWHLEISLKPSQTQWIFLIVSFKLELLLYLKWLQVGNG